MAESTRWHYLAVMMASFILSFFFFLRVRGRPGYVANYKKERELMYCKQ